MTDIHTEYDTQNHHQKSNNYATNEQDFDIPSTVVFGLSSHIVDPLADRFSKYYAFLNRSSFVNQRYVLSLSAILYHYKQKHVKL